MAKLKFKDITKATRTKDVNLLTGRGVRKTNKKTTKPKGNNIPSVDFSEESDLLVTMSNKYKGRRNNIAGFISDLPKELRGFLTNGKLTKVVSNHDSHIFVVDNMFTFKMRETMLGKHKKVLLTVRHKKKQIAKQYI